ncbi:MAG TPA: amidohydrolase family protein [Candidatus Brocadiia bacterium]|nr:amidohydrolase family protein [Candidatus Brocadiia bacterium]
MWRETAKHERNMRIFREELDAFLPERILDFHVHVINREAVPAERPLDTGGHRIGKYDFDDLDQDLRDTYPGRETSAVCFGFPDIHYSMVANNRYVQTRCDRRRHFPLRLFDPSESDPAAVEKDIAEGGFLGIKPYLDYVRKSDPNSVEIAEMLPDWIMEIVARRGLIVMLHIPRRGRLADPINQDQIISLCRRWPEVKIVLAHVGRAYFLKNVVGNLDKLKSLPNLWYDLAMLNNWEVLEHLFSVVPREKILYATDIPIALAPGKSVEINDQYTYVTSVPWHLSISDDHRKLVFTSFLYEEIRAIRKAVGRLGLGDSFVESVFHDNGAKLLKEAGV